MAATSEVKILGDDGTSLRVGGYGVVFHGRDVVGDQFLPSTDLWLDKLSPTPPVLFDHGGDDMLKRAVVGRVERTQPDDVGLWIEAKLTASRKYLDAIRHLVKEGVLGWSSGAVGHLVDRTKSKVLTSWAIAEFSLTATPAEPRTLGVRQIKSLATFESALEPLLDGDDLIDAREEIKAAKGGPLMEGEEPQEQEQPQLRGAAATIAEFAKRLSELATQMEGDTVAMERFGTDTKDCHRFFKGSLGEYNAIRSEMGHLAEWAQSIDEGEDGLRRVNFYKHRLALIQLEASA